MKYIMNLLYNSRFYYAHGQTYLVSFCGTVVGGGAATQTPEDPGSNTVIGTNFLVCCLQQANINGRYHFYIKLKSSLTFNAEINHFDQ